MSWYNKGSDGIAKERARQDKRYGPPRFWVPVGEKREVVFIDDQPVCLYEHNPQIAGKWKNWFTCLQGVVDRPPCCTQLGPDSRYYIGFYTIVQCTLWQDRAGNDHQYEQELFGAKITTLEMLEEKRVERESDGGLVNAIYMARRKKRTDATVGREHEFVRRVEDMDKLFSVTKYKGTLLSDLYRRAETNEEMMERLRRTFQVEFTEDGTLKRKIFPFNYVSLFEPRDPEDIRLLIGCVDRDSSSGGGDSNGARVDSNIPF